MGRPSSKLKVRIEAIGAVVVLVGIVISAMVLNRRASEPTVHDTAGPRLKSLPPAEVLRDGRLAALPPSASDVRAEHWSGIFTGEQFMMFRAEAREINDFIGNSEGVRARSPVMLPSRGSGACGSFDELSENPRYTPHWYRPRGITRGRCLEIPPNERGHNWGAIAIDDERNAVYVRVTWD